LAQRHGIEAAAQSIVRSAEYRARANGAAVPIESGAYEQGVRAAYRHLLGRDADPEGLQTSMQVASVYGLGAVVDRIVSSREYTERYGDNAVPGRADQRFCAPTSVPRAARPRGR
jgi:hypothetical protein